jgi:hypothetical protein
LIGCTIDRLQAFKSPMTYRTIKQGRRVLLIAGVSFLIAFAAAYWPNKGTVEACWRGYCVYTNNPTIPTYIYVAIRVSSVLVLFTSTSVLCWTYYKIESDRKKKFAAGAPATIKSSTLTSLLFIQIFVSGCGSVAITGSSLCWSIGLADICSTFDTISAVALTVQYSYNFLFYIISSKQFRSQVKSLFRAAPVAPLVNHWSLPRTRSTDLNRIRGKPDVPVLPPLGGNPDVPVLLPTGEEPDVPVLPPIRGKHDVPVLEPITGKPDVPVLPPITGK